MLCVVMSPNSTLNFLQAKHDARLQESFKFNAFSTQKNRMYIYIHYIITNINIQSRHDRIQVGQNVPYSVRCRINLITVLPHTPLLVSHVRVARRASRLSTSTSSSSEVPVILLQPALITGTCGKSISGWRRNWSGQSPSGQTSRLDQADQQYVCKSRGQN